MFNVVNSNEFDFIKNMLLFTSVQDFCTTEEIDSIVSIVIVAVAREIRMLVMTIETAAVWSLNMVKNDVY